MALKDLCYRCPGCGHDPMNGEGDRAWCRSCGTRIRRRGDQLFSTSAGGRRRRVTASALSREIERRGGPISPQTFRADGTLEYSARTMVSWRISEEPVWHRGVLRGFSETMSPEVPGRVTANREALTVQDGRRRGGRWGYLELRALQSSSSALQISLPGNRLVQFRFTTDSPKRWEDLLRSLVRETYHRAGRGDVVEFQPAIVTRSCGSRA